MRAKNFKFKGGASIYDINDSEDEFKRTDRPQITPQMQ